MRKMLGLAAALILVFAMGTVVYAATTHSGSVKVEELKPGDILEKDTEVCATFLKYLVEYVYIDETEVYFNEQGLASWTATEKLRLVSSYNTGSTSGGSIAYCLKFERVTDPPATVAESSTEPQMSAAERWKNSHQNPDNYLPWFYHKDGTKERAAFPAHYDEGKADCVYAVATTAEDFCRTLGITNGNTVHMKSWHSLCGEKMKQLMADYAALIGEQCSAEVTVGEIFELETEIRDRDYNLLGLAEESETPVEIKIGIEGELRELSDTMDFAVVMWADGEAVILKDVDEEPWTITIKTTRTSGVFGIIYAPAGSFDGLS